MVEIGSGMVAIAAGIAIGATGLAAAWAEKDIGTAAVGAIAENPKNFGRSLVLTVIPETIVIFGLVIAFLLMSYI
jgi:V/A-type H+-transporting ATPase subunit K